MSVESFMLALQKLIDDNDARLTAAGAAGPNDTRQYLFGRLVGLQTAQANALHHLREEAVDGR